MAPISGIAEGSSAGQMILGSLLLLVPIVAGVFAVSVRRRRGDQQRALFEASLRRHVIEKGGRLIELPHDR
jgi:hypothetical protein